MHDVENLARALCADLPRLDRSPLRATREGDGDDRRGAHRPVAALSRRRFARLRERRGRHLPDACVKARAGASGLPATRADRYAQGRGRGRLPRRSRRRGRSGCWRSLPTRSSIKQTSPRCGNGSVTSTLPQCAATIIGARAPRTARRLKLPTDGEARAAGVDNVYSGVRRFRRKTLGIPCSVRRSVSS